MRHPYDWRRRQLAKRHVVGNRLPVGGGRVDTCYLAAGFDPVEVTLKDLLVSLIPLDTAKRPLAAGEPSRRLRCFYISEDNSPKNVT